MNKKIKIIDIFNIISKGDYEALPLNIQVDGNKYNWDDLEHFYGREDRDDEDLLELARVYDTVTFLDMNVEVLDNNLEDNTEEIEELDTLNAYKLMESPYMVKLLKEQRYDEFMEHLKQSEVEIANTIMKAEDKINELVRAVNKLRKEKE